VFEASHILPRHPGKCSRLHGHSWKLRVEVEGPLVPASQFVMDYATLSSIVEPIVERFDHRHLNCLIQYPSAENISIHIAHELRPQLAGMDRIVVAVSETEKTWAIWDSRRTQDLRILDVQSDDEQEWRAPKMEKVITDVEKAKDRIRRLENLANLSLDTLTGSLSEALQLQMYIDSLDFNPVVPKKPILQ
jgi:6-pyruvoyltetrahydropterin/6-carboxytetrahydropterin synthase